MFCRYFYFCVFCCNKIRRKFRYLVSFMLSVVSYKCCRLSLLERKRSIMSFLIIYGVLTMFYFCFC